MQTFLIRNPPNRSGLGAQTSQAGREGYPTLPCPNPSPRRCSQPGVGVSASGGPEAETRSSPTTPPSPPSPCPSAGRGRGVQGARGSADTSGEPGQSPRVRRGERRGGEERAELNAGIQHKRHEKCLGKLCRGISGFLSSN